MKKILIVITTGMAPYGGLTTVMMNYYRAMDRSELKIDFASTNVLCDELRDELKQNNSNYYNLGDRKKCLPIYIYKLKKVLQINQYDVIHVNGNSATMLFELGIAKKIGVPVRIAHCHTSKTSHPFINNILIDEFKKNYTKAVSVSSTAGDWLYGKNNYTILNNAINTEKYRFCKNIRNEYRNKYNLEGKFVVGHVGKLYEPKNHLFLLKIFCELKKICQNAVLLLVGDGHLADILKNECKKLGIDNDVIFTGMRRDSNNFLQAMDIFVFPSLWEGLPLAVIEAQVSGLKCIVSSNVTTDTKCTENIIYKDLTDSAFEWAKEILTFYDNNIDRHNVLDSIRKHGFDITYEAMRLRKIYLS